MNTELPTVVYPGNAHPAYKIAAEQFSVLARQVAGMNTELIRDCDFEAFQGKPVVLIGTDAVNSVLAGLFVSGEIDLPDLRIGTDEYAIVSLRISDTDVLVLAGARPRAVLYAVYRYFEVFCGCRWFWDGDRINKTQLRFENINLVEKPRFEYRGTRYFAHRGLHRFQAEHWSIEDWKKEIDWLLKKRFNFFMLRIGADDLYQKAFPDIVSYPDFSSPLPEAGEGYDDRNLFWTLQYRGQLRKELLKYAFDRDLMHPEDCGTMTHWYCRTPVEYLEKVRPKLLLGQKTGPYSESTGLVWDIRDDSNLKNYFKLTQTHIEEYGKAELFHTIGLAERSFSDEREENLRLKINVYHKISAYLQEKYPNARLLLASWDLWMFYKSDEVRRLLSTLDQRQTILFDYTSDTVTSSNYQTWGVLGSFPWIFGIFGAYEANNEIRGFYGLINERTVQAKQDPKCIGYVYWPELSHGDTFCGEYTAYNAWEEDTPSLSEMTDMYCKNRYPDRYVEPMRKIWRSFMPIVEMQSWSMGENTHVMGTDLFFHICKGIEFSEETVSEYCDYLRRSSGHFEAAGNILLSLAETDAGDELLRRDIFDISRTVIGRFINLCIMTVGKEYRSGNAENIRKYGELAVGLTRALGDLLSLHGDYSMYDSLVKLRETAPVKPDFEKTLKHNVNNYYCRSYIFEAVKYLYVPEETAFFDEVAEAAAENRPINYCELGKTADRISEQFEATPLEDMKNTGDGLSAVLIKAAGLVMRTEL